MDLEIGNYQSYISKVNYSGSVSNVNTLGIHSEGPAVVISTVVEYM